MDPLALLPYALAAAGGRIDQHDVTALVAAGVTLLQRSAPLVRALAGNRSAVLLPPGSAWLVALAASDGRGMVVLPPDAPVDSALLDRFTVGAVFTSSTKVGLVPPGVATVLLDDAPYRARVTTGDRDATIDLGSHFGLDLAGDTEGPGSPEECVLLGASGSAYSHAEVLRHARDTMARLKFSPMHHAAIATEWTDLESLSESLLAPLLAGGTISTLRTDDGAA